MEQQRDHNVPMQVRHVEQKIKSLRDIFLWFWNFTSLAGVTQSRDSDNIFSKCAWMLLALCGYALTLYGVSFSINQFLQHEFNTKVSYNSSIGFKTQMSFPSVTICNTNRVHCGHLYNLIQDCTKVRCSNARYILRPL